jgi:AcrR family transcriptional regulator
MSTGPKATIFSAGMASSEGVQQAAQPLFPPATGRLRGQTPERVAHEQKARLEAAMVEAVARHGYAGTTLRELVRLAGVSKTTFYEHFESKQECFLATFDEIITQVTERVGSAYREEGDFRERLVAALTVFMNIVVSEPEAAKLAMVESLTLGAAGVAHRERGLEAFEVMIRQSFDRSPAKDEVPATTVRAIASGIRGVVYRRLRSGNVEELPGLVDELVDWALGYQQPDGKAVRLAAGAGAEPQTGVTDTGGEEELDWKEPPDSARSRAELNQRERIVRAVGQLVVENGYDTLSIPAISARAGTSNQTFYEHFSNKREAFLAAFDASAADGLIATTKAFEAAGDSPKAVGAALRAMLEHIAAHELFAQLTFFDLQTAGPVALDRADSVMDAFTAFLRPGIAPKGIGRPVPDAVLQAVGSGAWSVIQHELVQGNADSLPELGPELARIVLTPFSAR